MYRGTSCLSEQSRTTGSLVRTLMIMFLHCLRPLRSYQRQADCFVPVQSCVFLHVINVSSGIVLIIHCSADHRLDDTFLAPQLFIYFLYHWSADDKTRKKAVSTQNKTDDIADKLSCFMAHNNIFMDGRGRERSHQFIPVSTREEVEGSPSCTRSTPFLSPSTVGGLGLRFIQILEHCYSFQDNQRHFNKTSNV